MAGKPRPRRRRRQGEQRYGLQPYRVECLPLPNQHQGCSAKKHHASKLANMQGPNLEHQGTGNPSAAVPLSQSSLGTGIIANLCRYPCKCISSLVPFGLSSLCVLRSTPRSLWHPFAANLSPIHEVTFFSNEENHPTAHRTPKEFERPLQVGRMAGLAGQNPQNRISLPHILIPYSVLSKYP